MGTMEGIGNFKRVKVAKMGIPKDFIGMEMTLHMKNDMDHQECLCVRIFASLEWFCSPLSTCCNYLSLLCKCNQLFARSSCAQKIIMFFEDERRKKWRFLIKFCL